MSELIIDPSVFDAIGRGNTGPAEVLLREKAAGTKLYVSEAGWLELTGPGRTRYNWGPDSAQMRAAFKRTLEDFGVERMPSDRWTGSNSQRLRIIELNFSLRNNAVSERDLPTVTQAIVTRTPVFGVDGVFRNAWQMLNRTFGQGQQVVHPASHQVVIRSLERPFRYRVLRKLLNLKRIWVVGGVVHETKPVQKKTRRGGSGSGGGGSGGVPLPPKSPPPTAKMRVAAGASVAVMVANVTFGWLSDRKQQQRAEEALERERPKIYQTLEDNVELGALLVFESSSTEPGEAGSVTVFDELRVSYGPTRDEARYALRNIPKQTPTYPKNPTVPHEEWIPPTAEDYSKRPTPLPAVGIGTFRSGKAKFQNVEWGGVTDFDDMGVTELDVPGGVKPRFFILDAPKVIMYSRGRYFPEEEIEIVPHDLDRDSGFGTGTQVLAVDLDPSWPTPLLAVMVYPADKATAEMFEAVPATRDNTKQLRNATWSNGFGPWQPLLNFSAVRWIRPENIRVLRDFGDERHTKMPSQFDAKYDDYMSGSMRSMRASGGEDPVRR